MFALGIHGVGYIVPYDDKSCLLWCKNLIVSYFCSVVYRKKEVFAFARDPS